MAVDSVFVSCLHSWLCLPLLVLLLLFQDQVSYQLCVSFNFVLISSFAYSRKPSYVAQMWVGSRDSKLEIRVWRRSKNVSRKRYNSGKYSDTDDNSALLLHSKSVGNLMVIWYGVLPVYLEKLESEKTQAIRLKKRHTYTCIACSGTFNTLATKFVLHMITLWSNPAFVVIFRMYGLFQTTFYFGYMALFSLGLGIMCGKHCSWLLSLKCLDIVRRSYMFITFGRYNFPCVQQVHLGMPGQVPSSRRFILR